MVADFLPKAVPLPMPGFTFYVSEGTLYAAETETSGSVLATSFVEIGSLWWIVWAFTAEFFLGAVARALSRRFLRPYFAVIAALPAPHSSWQGPQDIAAWRSKQNL